ncbi:hypothetical protein PsYK624_140880 [Phanerochaete sordida]|uniref:Myb/SANT-like domain-containing protein n=1 Tax=Phanerochaete sordida TaxID=48140 RepID=A0A9P3GMS2_9APHY|nr:hypothetical protein PsYK624_140880 [Phanerochaete sordida]
MPPPAASPRFKSARTVAMWSAADDELLADLLLEARARGEPFASPRDAFWEAAAARLRNPRRDVRSRGAKKDAKKCYARLNKNFKPDLANIEFLREGLGVKWNEDRKMLNASPERWEQILELDGKHQRFCDTPWPLYDKIKLLYSEDDAMNVNAPSEKSGDESTTPAIRPLQ